MGGRLLRRKALTAPAALLAAAFAAAALALAAPAAAADEPPTAPVDAPLPAAQGHAGIALYSIAIPDEDIIRRTIDSLLAQRADWLQAVLERSVRFRALIVQAVEERGLPRELQFLPAVESGFQPRAVSPRGATGLWQLMRNTAAPFGLRMDQWVDERRDFWKSTEASLDKLADNEAVFGDWCLALAAYNCGVGKLKAIMRRYPQSDYWTLRRKGVLPRETAAFVPQFLAMSRIFASPGRYGLEVGWNPSPEWQRIPLDKTVDLRILSRASGVPFDVLSAANAELNFPITPPPSYGYQLKVPSEYAAAVEDALAHAPMPLLEFRVHVVAPGDTLSEMALAYGVSVEMIQEFNPSLSPRALRLGARVLVPAGARARGPG